MGIHQVQLGKQKFVCGLFWQSLSRPRELAAEARALAHKIDADLFVLRKDHTMAQAGYAHTRDGARAGQCSLATVVAQRLAQEGAHYNGQQQAAHNWLAAFRLPDGMWAYLAVRDANFLPSGDFAGTREQVLERLHGDYALGGWNVVLGEPELETLAFHNFQPRTLDQLLSWRRGKAQAPAWARLRAARHRIAPRRLALGALVLLLAVVAALWLRQRHAAEDELRRAQAFAQARQALAAAPAPAPPAPWHTLAPPADLVRRCLAQLRHLAPGGWRLEQFDCSAGTATHSWRRGDSWLGLLLAAVPQAQVDAAGDRATLATPLPAGATRQEPLLPAATALRTLQGVLQPLGVRLQAAERPAPRPAPGAPPSPPPPWRSYGVNVALDRLAPDALPALLELPGLRLDKVTYRAGAWSLEGVLYAK